MHLSLYMVSWEASALLKEYILFALRKRWFYISNDELDMTIEQCGYSANTVPSHFVPTQVNIGPDRLEHRLL